MILGWFILCRLNLRAGLKAGVELEEHVEFWDIWERHFTALCKVWHPTINSAIY